MSERSELLELADRVEARMVKEVRDYYESNALRDRHTMMEFAANCATVAAALRAKADTYL